jgi:hypothetical protein
MNSLVEKVKDMKNIFSAIVFYHSILIFRVHNKEYRKQGV